MVYNSWFAVEANWRYEGGPGDPVQQVFRVESRIRVVQP